MPMAIGRPLATMEDRSRITWLRAIEWGQDWHPRMASGLSQNRPTSANLRLSPPGWIGLPFTLGTTPLVEASSMEFKEEIR